jgi:hypothetical protein
LIKQVTAAGFEQFRDNRDLTVGFSFEGRPVDVPSSTFFCNLDLNPEGRWSISGTIFRTPDRRPDVRNRFSVGDYDRVLRPELRSRCRNGRHAGLAVRLQQRHAASKHFNQNDLT